MSNQLIIRLKALLRALILILLLGTGLWMMDKISQNTMAGRAHQASPRTRPEDTAQVAAQQPSTMPSIGESKPVQEQAPLPDASSVRTPTSPAPNAGGKAVEAVKQEAVSPTAHQPKDESSAAHALKPASGAADAPGAAALPRIVSRTDGRYIMTEPILFNTAMATIRQVSTPSLKGISTLLKQNPEIKLLVIGYTDNLGLPENNQRVSNERAAAIRDFLIAQGVDAARLESKGMGSRNPIAPNDTQLGRQANRRIEFLITSPK